MSKVLVRFTTFKKVQSFENSLFKKQEVLAISHETKTDYKLEFSGSSIDLLKGVNPNQDAIIDFNIRGNRFFKKDKQGNLTTEEDVINVISVYKVTLL